MTMYASENFKTKAAFKKAVKEGKKVYLWSAGIGEPKQNGTEHVSGPHYPQPHKWYATVEVVNGIVTKVKS